MNKKTYKYFKDRERKHQEQKIKDDEKFSKVLEKEYQRTLREIENRINWWIGKYADDNEINIEQAKQIVREADVKELKEKAKEYVKNKDVSPKANKEMRIYNLKMKIARDELLQKYIDLELAKLGTKEEKLLEDRIFNETEEELKRQAGILGDSLISKEKVKDVFEQIVNDSHVSANFSNYIWTNIKELRNDLQNGLNRSILRGQNPNVWKSDLFKHFKGNVKKAEFYARRLAVTETAIAQTKAGLISAKENGYDKVIVITEPGACKHCKPHDGNIVDLDEAEMGKNVPIWHPFCRCTVAAYYEYEDNEIIGDDEIIFKDITYEYPIGKVGRVIKSNEVTIDGVVYRVDGKRVVSDHDEYEVKIARWISKKLGGDVELIPRVIIPEKVRTPDYLWNGESWDLKRIYSHGKNTLSTAVKNIKGQSNNVILDLIDETYTNQDLLDDLERIYINNRYSYVDKILISQNFKLRGVYKRK